MALAALSFAQEGVKPEFQAFASSLLKLKPAEGGWQKFSLKVEVAPWAFQAIGEVHIVAGDPELLNTALYDGTVYAVVAYIPSTAAGSDGKEYQVGVFDMMLFLEDEATQVRNVKFRLLPPANDEWAMGIFKDAIATGTALGSVWGGAFEEDVVKASAVPLDKKQLQANLKSKERPAAVEPAPVAKSSRNSDDDTPVVKKKKKRSYNEDEEDEDGSNLTVKEKRRRAMLSKKKAAAEEAEEEEEPVVKKKKKKKSYDEDEEEPVVKKKKKKRSYDEDEEEEPVVKKKKKKKVVEDDEEEEPVVKKKKKKKKKKVVYEDDEDEE